MEEIYIYYHTILTGMGGYGADEGIVGSEKAAVISGCVGGLLLVVFLVASYCFCLPSDIKRRLNRHRQKAEDEEKAAASVVNGGSVVVKSSSRGSALVNQDSEPSHKDITDLTGSQPEKRNLPSRSVEPQRFSESVRIEEVSTSCPARQNGYGEILQGVRGLSMSIPDVTKVEQTFRMVDDKPSLPIVPAPQFYTLGRHTRATNRSTLRGPNGHIYNTSEVTLYEQQQQHVRYSVGTPQYFGVVRPQQKSASQDTNSDDDAHISDQILCDDRGISPPPPAPADSTLTYTIHNHPTALL